MRLMRVSPGRIGSDLTSGTGRKHTTPHMEMTHRKHAKPHIEMTNQAVNAQLDAGGNGNVDAEETRNAAHGDDEPGSECTIGRRWEWKC